MDYQKGYTLLFNRITDALTALEQQNYGTAVELLRRAQVDAEELYLKNSESMGEDAP